MPYGKTHFPIPVQLENTKMSEELTPDQIAAQAQAAAEKEAAAKQKAAEKEAEKEAKKAQKAAEKEAKKAEKLAEAEKKKAEKEASRQMQHGVSRPLTGVTKTVWDIADKISGEMRRPAERAEVTEEGLKQGIQQGTIHTQYGRWRKYNGLTSVRQTKPAAETAPSAPTAPTTPAPSAPEVPPAAPVAPTE